MNKTKVSWLRKGVLTVALCGAASLCCGSASALTLVQAYEAALKNDPTYRMAYYDRESGKEYVNLGRSSLLPNLAASSSMSNNRADVNGRDFLDRASLTHPHYTSRVSTVQLRQSILNLEGIARYKQGAAQTKYSEVEFLSRGQDLILRLVGSYLDVLYATEQLNLAQGQRETYIEQSKVNANLFEKGEGTKTDMLETQARLDLAEAQFIEAQDNVRNARNTLAGIVGEDVDQLQSLSEGFKPFSLAPTDFEAWKKQALANNADIQAQLFAIETARQEINKNKAGHAPRLDFVASYSKNTAETINTYNQDSTVRSVGFQLNVPIYSGGYVSAATRQAVAGYEKSRADLEARTDKVLVEVRKQYNAVLSNMAKIAALNKAVESGNLLVLATRQSIKGGVRINLDLLNAQQQVNTAQRDLAQARYSYLLSMLKLRGAAGTLSGDDVRQMAVYFR